MLFKILIFSVIILAIYIVFFKNKVKKNVSKNIENFDKIIKPAETRAGFYNYSPLLLFSSKALLSMASSMDSLN